MSNGKEPIQTVNVSPDEMRVLDAFRHIKAHKHGEMQVAVKNGGTVKLWTTDKWDLEIGKLREVGQ